MSGMRRAFAMASALLLLPAVACADDPYADFRIPEHRSFAWLVTTSTNASGRFGGTPNGQSRIGALSSQLSTSLRWHAEGEPREWDLRLESRLGWNRSRSQSNFPSAVLDERVSRFRNDDQSLSLSAARNDFLRGGSFFISYDASSTLAYAQTIISGDGHSISPPFESSNSSMNAERRYEQFGAAEVGAGVGRIRNVTGVYSAQLLEQRLLATGRLARPLSDETRRRLAALYYIAPDFSLAHERSGKYFWREAERVLREDGALEGGSLDAYSLFRLLEPATRFAFWSRSSGATVSAIWSVSDQRGHADFDSRSSSAFYSSGVLQGSSAATFAERHSLDLDGAFVGLSTGYQRPVGLRWQTGWNTAARYGGGRSRTVILTSSAQASWLVADRWYASGVLRHTEQSARLDGVRFAPNWQFTVDALVGYWVEDSWSLELALRQRQNAFRSQRSLGSFAGYQREASLDIGITYHPAGRFSASDLGITQRLTTPPL